MPIGVNHCLTAEDTALSDKVPSRKLRDKHRSQGMTNAVQKNLIGGAVRQLHIRWVCLGGGIRADVGHVSLEDSFAGLAGSLTGRAVVRACGEKGAALSGTDAFLTWQPAGLPLVHNWVKEKHW